MSRPTGATHQHEQTKYYYRKDQYGFWEYYDGEMWVASCHIKEWTDRIKLLD